MKIVKIKDKFMYKPKTARERAKYKPDGSHTYLVYSDRKTGEIRGSKNKTNRKRSSYGRKTSKSKISVWNS